MYCKNCGKEILKDFNVCPYCQAPIEQSSTNYPKGKFNPYFKRENSIYKKHPFLAWTITIIVIVGGLWLMHQGIEESKSNARYNSGYKSVYQK